MGKQGVFKPGLEGVIAGETNISFLDTEAEQIVIKGYDLIELAEQKHILTSSIFSFKISCQIQWN